MSNDAPTPDTPPATAQPDAPPAQGPAQSSTNGAATGTAEAERPKNAPPRMDKLPPFRVLLHNDEHNDMGFVVASLVELTPLPRAAAISVMLTAHRRGLALVLTTHRERAELYRDQLRSKGLRATIEPAN